MAANPAALPLRIHEIGMVLPNLIRIEIRDESVSRGEFVKLESPDPGDISTRVTRTNPYTQQEELAWVCGEDKTYLRFLDRQPTNYLNRAAAKVANDWAISGGYTITDVYYKNKPYDAGDVGPAIAGVSMQHFIYLQLDGNLTNATYTITPPAGTGFSATEFIFNDKTTRCVSLHCSQIGFRPGDTFKGGYFSQWVPGYGIEGAVPFAGLTAYIIDAKGAERMPCAVVLRNGPNDANERGGFGWDSTEDTTLLRFKNGLIRYASVDHTPLVGVSVTNANPGVIEYADGDWVPKNGETYSLSGWNGINFGREFVRVSNVNTVAKTFEINIDTTSKGSHNPGAYLEGYDSLIQKTVLQNHSRTYVYGIDFEDLDGPQGGYRIYVPGVGVTEEFQLDESVYYRVAKNQLEGIYHHRLGIALTGHGYERPSCYADGVNADGIDVGIYHSTLPMVFSSELNLAGGSAISSANGDESPWITANRAVGFKGLHMDAGDWDAHIYKHVPGMYTLLTHGYELLPPNGRNTNFGIPKSSVVFGSTYAGTDGLPDAVHEALWTMEGYRSTQREDGAVSSGMGMPRGALTEGAGPSWASLGNNGVHAFLYAPDHLSNFVFASTAAKLAIIFADEGLSTLATLWQESAQAAWDWAEAIYLDITGDDVTGAADAYYDTELDMKTKAGWSQATYDSKLSTLNNLALVIRAGTAGCMLRMTEGIYYRDIVEPLVGQSAQSWYGVAMREYLRSESPDAGIAASFTSSLASGIGPFTWLHQINHDLSYRFSGFIDSSSMGPSVAEAPLHIDSYNLLSTPAVLNALQAGLAYVLGANQYEHCFPQGLGSRDFTTILHEDFRRGGLVAPPVGISVYGADFPGILSKPANFDDDRDGNFVVEFPTGDHEDNYGTARVYEPHRMTRPFAEQTVENLFVITHMEYTWYQRMLQIFITAMLLHSYDDNTQAANASAKVRKIMNFVGA